MDRSVTRKNWSDIEIYRRNIEILLPEGFAKMGWNFSGRKVINGGIDQTLGITFNFMKDII